MSETNLIRSAMRWLGTQPDSWAFKVHGGPCQRSGVPDIVGQVRGRALFAEAKSATRKLSKIQVVTHDRIGKSGGFVFTFRSLSEFRSWVELLRCKPCP